VKRLIPQALLLTNISQLLTLRGPSGARRGRELGELTIIEDGAVLCAGGKIVAVGTRREAARDAWLKSRRARVSEFDCGGGVLLPGFVDSHTHPAFLAPRLVDFEKRIAGASYEEIAAAGGGIRSSVDAVRRASRAELARHVSSALDRMLAHGTTTVECKSGYGLSSESELKSLQAIRDAARRWPGTVAATLLGAHVVPREFAERRAEYVREVCEVMIPKAARAKLASFVDVFVERGAFTMAEAEQMFAAAAAHSLATRAHVCQLSEIDLAPLLRFAPTSLDHLDHVTAADLRLLAQQDTVCTLVPGANYFLGLDRYPRARDLIDGGAAVALATDFNPGSSPTPSMQFVLSLACTHTKMSPAEAIAAATINGAHALRLADRKGSIEPGKDADLALFDVADYREIAYWFGVNRCSAVVIGSAVVTQRDGFE
jgi:imidazolonepropionase